MALDTTAAILERLVERYRPTYPHERLLFCVDRRPESKLRLVVVAIASNSDWFDLLPPEQLVELVPDDRPRRS